MAKRGRPSRFNETLAEAILALAETGATDPQICDKLQIPLRTLVGWKERHPDFKRAVGEAKSIADDLVEQTLFRMAVGGHLLPKLKIVYDQDRGEFKTHQYAEILAPDVGACSLWLRNRRPEAWRSNPPEVPQDPTEEDGETVDATWRIVGFEGDGDAERHHDRKPPLKVVGPPAPE